jgi:hypothetical protein
MSCSERIADLVDLARADRRNGLSAVGPHRELRAHLAVCAGCRDRWDAERQLTAQLGIIRAGTAVLRSSDQRRKSLLQDFSQVHRHKAVASWAWALGAAAALLLAVFLGHAAGKWTRPAVRSKTVRSERTFVYQASLSSDASALSSDDFIAVPYTPPLAPGEMVRVVHADLDPDALASMGVEVDPSWAGDLPTDVVVGEDGLPRAVRIADNGLF